MDAPPLTLLQVTPALDAGGVERTTLDIAGAVVRGGGRALVASAGGRMEAELARRGGELVPMAVDSKAPWIVADNIRRLVGVIRREGVSIVHARSRAPAWSALAAARLTRTPFVTTYAGVYNARSKLKRLYNSVMARGDVVIANSSFTREHLLAAHGTDPARVTTIPRGVDLDRFAPDAVSPERVAEARAALGLRASETRPVFLLAGRVTRWKGQALLIEAMAHARLDALLVLAGDDQGRGLYREELARLARALGVEHKVLSPGHFEDMPAAYLACDFACSPSIEPEAFGRTAVEPQAMGRPVLAAAHGAPCETVKDGQTGWLVAPGDLAAWTAALKRAVAIPPQKRAAMGAAGRANVAAHYSLTAMTDATLAAYARLLAKGA